MPNQTTANNKNHHLKKFPEMYNLIHDSHHHNRSKYEEVVLQTKGVKGVLRLCVLWVLGANLGDHGFDSSLSCSTTAASPGPGPGPVSTAGWPLPAGGGPCSQHYLKEM